MKKLSLILTVFIVGCSTNQIGLTSVKDIFDAPKIDRTAPGNPAPVPKSIMLPFKFLQ